MHADGTHRQTMPIHDPTLNLGPGAWSPDGKQIAFEGWNDNPGRNGVYIGRVPDGTDLVRLTRNPAKADDIPMDFSPDGSRMVILRTGIDKTISDTGAPTGSLFVMNVDGTDLHRITPPEVDVATTARWSPNGKWIVFSGPWDELRGPIWAVRPDGTGLRKVFEDPKDGTAITPTWSPDGHKIMFGLNPYGNTDEHESNKLSVINADGTGYEVVLDLHSGEREPEWIDR